MPGLTYLVRSRYITPGTKRILLALSPLSLWHYAVSYRYIQSSEILSLMFDHTCVISNFSCLPPGLPASPSKKIVVKMGLVIIIYLEALCYIWGMISCLIIIFSLIITLNLLRLLSLVLLLGGCYKECWNASCCVCRFILSKTTSPGIKKVNLPGAAPFRDLTVPLSPSSCLQSGLLPWIFLLLILHHGSMLFTELSKKQFETYARKEAFHYMK